MLNIEYPAQGLGSGWSLPRAPFIAVVHDFLGRAECAELVGRIESIGPGAAPITVGGGQQVMMPDIRNNDRVMFEDVALAASLFERLRPALPAREDTAVGLNERFRGYRYTAGQRFQPHYDGAYVRNERERSEITVLLYLSDGFLGGDTLFNDLNVRVTPKTGMALLFEHPVLHEGCAVLAGTKYVLRSDVMYRR
jgi:predicted 2-oxoglutarate/Fe(II)-dependent dioxygenase YbiX